MVEDEIVVVSSIGVGESGLQQCHQAETQAMRILAMAGGHFQAGSGWRLLSAPECLL